VTKHVLPQYEPKAVDGAGGGGADRALLRKSIVVDIDSKCWLWSCPFFRIHVINNACEVSHFWKAKMSGDFCRDVTSRVRCLENSRCIRRGQKIAKSDC
jgi:hypothetical protein